MHDDHLRGVPRCDRKSGGAAFKGRNSFFEHGTGRVADARVDISEGLQSEQRGSVVDVVKYE